MKKYLIYISLVGLLFASCEKLPPVVQKAGINKDGQSDDNASDTGDDNDDKPNDIVIGGGNGDLDVITDPNNDEDYDNEGKKPSSGGNSSNN